MNNNLLATAKITINAPKEQVWEALTNPLAIKQYMFGTNVVSDWRVGGPIVWKGEWQGKPYEDKGVILQIQPGQLVQYSHFSPLSGMPDAPENYHIVTVLLSGDSSRTTVALTQDHNASEQERAESEKNWGMMLASLKQFLEKTTP